MKRQFTLIEMLIVVAIIGILAALLAPSLRRALDSSRQIACINNLKKIGVMFHTYGNDFQFQLPVTMKFDKDGNPYNSKFYGAEGTSLEWLMVSYGGYGDFPAGRASGSEIWLCPSGTLRINPPSSGESGGGVYFSGNGFSRDWLNSYQSAMFKMYTDTYSTADRRPPVLSASYSSRMRLNYFPSRQALQYCSARAEMDAYNGYNQGRSNHERDPKGILAPRPILFVDGSARKLQHIAWLNHYESGIGSADHLHRGPYSGGGLASESGWTDFGLLPNSYPAGRHKPFTYVVIDP